jgi:hypothetical protein
MKFQIRPVRGDHFRFGSVFIKKSNQTEFFFLKKNRNRVKPTGFGSVFLGQKPVQTGLVGFSGFGSVFFGLAWFFRFGSVFFWFFVGFGFGSVFLVFCL